MTIPEGSPETNNLTWRPLLSGRGALPYEQVIHEIAAALEEVSVPSIDWGRPLLHGYLGASRGETGHISRAQALVDEAAEELATGFRPPSLYRGVAGAAWLCLHIDIVLDDLDETRYVSIDKFLLATVAQRGMAAGYDLISGLVGIGVYLLSRLPAPAAVNGIRRIIAELEGAAERMVDGRVRWKTPPSLLPSWQQDMAPLGYYNLGVAHGIPGAIAFLAQAYQRGLLLESQRDLLVGACQWVLSQRMSDGTLPSWIIPGRDPAPSRVAWCYGELGAAVALLMAASTIGDGTLREGAIELGASAARRRDDAGAVDAALCHGAAGNAHLFNRLFQATDLDEFRDSALWWYSRALQMRKHGEGVGGYVAWMGTRRTGTRVAGWVSDPSFLTGAGGIALAFLAAISSVEPTWDAVLLTNVAPGAAQCSEVETGATRRE